MPAIGALRSTDAFVLTNANEAHWPPDRCFDLGEGRSFLGYRFFYRERNGGWVGSDNLYTNFRPIIMPPTIENIPVAPVVNTAMDQAQAIAMDLARDWGDVNWENARIPYHEWIAATHEERSPVRGLVDACVPALTLPSINWTELYDNWEDEMPRRSRRCRSCGRVVGRSNGCHCRGTEGPTLDNGGEARGVRRITGEGIRIAGNWSDKEVLIRSEVYAVLEDLRSLHEMESVRDTDEIEIVIRVRRNPSA